MNPWFAKAIILMGTLAIVIILLYSSGQALVLPNWVAGPSYLVALALLFALRVGPEERMMLEEFGKEYEAYMARTKRLVPGVW